MLLQQDHFALVRYSAWERGENSTASRGTCGFFLVLQGRGIFTCGEEDVELAQNQYLYIKADETRGIQALEDLVVFAVKG